jgi:hypothetical protein
MIGMNQTSQNFIGWLMNHAWLLDNQLACHPQVIFGFFSA